MHQDPDPDLPTSVQESPAEAWVSGALLQGLGALRVPVRPRGLLKEVAIICINATVIWPQLKKQEGNIALPINRKLDYRFTEHGPSEQDPVSSTVSPIILLSLSVRGQTE